MYLEHSKKLIRWIWLNKFGVGQQYIDQSVSLNLFPSILTTLKWINQVTMEVGNKELKLYIT